MKTKYIYPEWPLQEKVCAFTTTRLGGVSKEPYDKLNLALHVKDEHAAVNENRNRLHANLPAKTKIKWLKQTHSNIAVNASEIEADLVEADAAYTTNNNIACAVLTADCLPILLSDKNGECVAAIHAGWRGVINGVINNTITAMSDFVCPEYAWLGPAIGAEVFEVGEDVYSAYMQFDEKMMECFKPGEPGKWNLNIYQAAKIVLKSADIDKVFGGDFCTYSDSDQFYSYRRKAITGRMATIIHKR